MRKDRRRLASSERSSLFSSVTSGLVGPWLGLRAVRRHAAERPEVPRATMREMMRDWRESRAREKAFRDLAPGQREEWLVERRRQLRENFVWSVFMLAGATIGCFDLFDHFASNAILYDVEKIQAGERMDFSPTFLLVLYAGLFVAFWIALWCLVRKILLGDLYLSFSELFSDAAQKIKVNWGLWFSFWAIRKVYLPIFFLIVPIRMAIEETDQLRFFDAYLKLWSP